MKKIKLTIALTFTLIMNIANAQNPFFEKYNTPYETAPFHKIKLSHYEEAIMEGMKRHNKEIDDIVANKENPTFKNTVEAYSLSGEMLGRVMGVMGNLQSAETSDELQALARKMAPLLSKHNNNIRLNEDLFKRIKYVYDNKSKENLDVEQRQLLEEVYKGFERSGANLPKDKRELYKALTEKLNLLNLEFSENSLKATNEYFLHVTDKSKLSGLPEGTLEAASEDAKERNLEGWVFTLHAPSYMPLMTYADNRELRKEIYMAYNTKCAEGHKYSNIDVVKNIVNTNREIAQLLGYKNFAEYRLENRMAKNSEGVYKLLNELLEAYKPVALEEHKEVSALAKSLQGEDFTIMPWDWSYYSNKLKNAKFSFNDEMLRPYFELNNVINGVFGLATRLYGITFKKNTDIPTYNKEVEAYEVYDRDGKFLSVLYTDFHPRASKRGGAWMTEYKGQWIDDKGINSRPHVSIVMNFTKPTADKPALLTFDEVVTFLHEFGHALHGMFANTKYEDLSGTNVYRDFVELPSQLMENFATEKEFLHTFAKHYKTGELIPDELVKKIVDSSNFNVGTFCVRQLSLAMLDMAWYTIGEDFKGNVVDFERKAWEKTQILPFVDGCCMSVQFSHIFAGGYSAGYYSYKWAEVLDADAFAKFKKEGVFNTNVAESFRNHILSKGGTEHPMELYKRFRGTEPTIDALLERNGIKK